MYQLKTHNDMDPSWIQYIKVTAHLATKSEALQQLTSSHVANNKRRFTTSVNQTGFH